MTAKRIEENDVGVGTDGDGAFAREEAEEFCGGCGDDFDEAIGREAFAVVCAIIVGGTAWARLSMPTDHALRPGAALSPMQPPSGVTTAGG